MKVMYDICYLYPIFLKLSHLSCIQSPNHLPLLNIPNDTLTSAIQYPRLITVQP